MRQQFRFFVRPQTFFNQLQWSSHHWFILISFLTVATLETLFGKQHLLYSEIALYIQQTLGIGSGLALWVVLFSKLMLMLAGAYLIIAFIWFVGNLIGERHSHRVLYRRLAVVFTVFLMGYTSNHLAHFSPWFGFVGLLLYGWALVLGFFAIREQFNLTAVETIVVSAFALLLVTSSLHFSNHLIENFCAMEDVAAKATQGQHVPFRK